MQETEAVIVVVEANVALRVGDGVGVVLAVPLGVPVAVAEGETLHVWVGGRPEHFFNSQLSNSIQKEETIGHTRLKKEKLGLYKVTVGR